MYVAASKSGTSAARNTGPFITFQLARDASGERAIREPKLVERPLWAG